MEFVKADFEYIQPQFRQNIGSSNQVFVQFSSFSYLEK